MEGEKEVEPSGLAEKGLSGHPQSSDPPPKKDAIITIATIVTCILWLLGVSTNGVFNFFNDSPGFQLYPFCLASCGLIAFLATRYVLKQKNIPWLFMVAAVLCVVFFVVTSKAVERKLKAISRIDYLEPEKDELTTDPNCKVVLIFGHNVVGANQSNVPLIKFENEPVLTLSVTADGATISGRFFDKNGNIVAKLKDNKFITGQDSFEASHPNKSTFSVRDRQDIEVLNVTFTNKNTFYITGVFRPPGYLHMPMNTEVLITETNVQCMGFQRLQLNDMFMVDRGFLDITTNGTGIHFSP